MKKALILVFVSVIIVTVIAQTKKISEMSNIEALDNTDLFLITSVGTNYNMTYLQLLSQLQTNITFPIGGTPNTVINSGASTVDAVPVYTDLTGTNVNPSLVTITAETNLNVPGIITVDELHANFMVLTNQLAVLVGGTGKTNLTSDRMLSGNGTNEFDEVIIGSGLSLSGTAGTSPRTLTSSGAGGIPNTVINSGTPLDQAIPIYAGVTGTNIEPSLVTIGSLTNITAGLGTFWGLNLDIPLGVVSGGTGNDTVTIGNGLVGNGVGAMDELIFGTGLSLSGSSGSTRTLNSTAINASTGTVINAGVPLIGALPIYSDTTGTNINPSSLIVTGLTNLHVPGIITTPEVTANQLILTNPLAVLVGGTGKTNLTTDRMMSGNGTNSFDEVIIGTGLNLSGTAGTSPRTLTSSGGLPSGIPGKVLFTDTNSAAYWARVPVIEEFLSATPGGIGFTAIAINGGSGAWGAGENGHWGAVNQVTTTATNGAGGTRLNNTVAGSFGTSNIIAYASFRTPALLSTLAEPYSVMVGFSDSTTQNEPTDGAYFYYYHATNDFWNAKCSAAASRSMATNINNVTYSASTWYDLRIDGNSTLVSFHISSDGGVTWTHVADQATNIPTGANTFGYFSVVVRMGGTTGANYTGLLDRVMFIQQ